MWTYDRQVVGKRIRVQRKAMKLTINAIAERIDKTPKFCADVERGSIDLSIETLLSLCSVLSTSPNAILLGATLDNENNCSFEEVIAQYTPAQRVCALELLQILVKQF